MLGIFFKSSKKIESREFIDKSVSDFIPYLCHYDDNTIITKAGDMMSVVKVSGFSFETADDDELEMKKQSRNNLFKGMSSDNLSISFHTFRRKYAAFPGGEFERDSFPDMLNKGWRKKHNPDRTYKNEHYVTIARKAPSGLSFFKKLIGLLSRDKSGNNEMLKIMASELKEMRDRVLNGLTSYRPKILGVASIDGRKYSEICEFLSFITNCGYNQNMLFPRGSIDRYISNTRLYFGRNVMEVVGSGYRKYVGIVSIKEYRPATYAGIMDGFLQLPFQFIMSQSFSFIDRMSAISKMQLQQRRLVQSEDVAISQIQEINEALDSAMSGVFAFGMHHATVLCIQDDLKSLESALSQKLPLFLPEG